MQDLEFDEIVSLICKEDARFDKKAYEFVRQGLDHTVKELRKKETAKAERSRHVSGPELLQGIRVFALDQYGPLAKTVLNEPKARRCTRADEDCLSIHGRVDSAMDTPSSEQPRSASPRP